MSSSVLEFLVSAPEIILVTTPEPTSITDSYALLKGLSLYEGFDDNNTRIRVVANKVSSASEGRALYEKLSMVVKQFLKINIEFLGIVSQDNAIPKAVMKQKPVSIAFPDSAPAHDFYNIAHTLETNEDPVFNRKNGIRNFLKNVFSKGM